MKAKAAGITGTILIIFIIAISAPFFIPQLFGIHAYAVLTGSMEPVYSEGCVVYVKTEEAAKIKAGDVITFMMGADSQQVTTHRVVENDTQNEVFITKGDANEAADAEEVSYKRLIGKVVGSLPHFGNFALLLDTAAGKAAEMIVLIVGALLWYLSDVLKKKENKSACVDEEKRIG